MFKNYFEKYAVKGDVFATKSTNETKKLPGDNPITPPTQPQQPTNGESPNFVETTPQSAPKVQQKPQKQTITLDSAYSDWKANPTPETMKVVLEKAGPVISQGMTSYGAANNPVLKGKAKKIAIDAIKSYDPEGDASLKSWIALNMQGIQRFTHSMAPTVIPERVKFDNMRIENAKKEMIAMTGQEPDNNELAEMTGLSQKRIEYVQSMSKAPMTEGYFAETGDDESSDTMPTEEANAWEDVWLEYVYHDLDPINKKIFDMSMSRGKYAGKEMSVKQMAEELGISAPAVSQRRNKIADKIAEAYEYGDQI